MAVHNCHKWTSKIIKSLVHCLLFADDLNIYTRGKNTETTQQELQKTIKLEKWSSEKYLKFLSSKTNLIIFSRKRKRERELKLTLRSTLIQSEEQITFLELVFDKNLS